MTPAEKQKLANLEAAVRAMSYTRHPATFLEVDAILARQPEPVAEPEKCSLGTPGCVRAGAHGDGECCRAYADNGNGICCSFSSDGHRCGASKNIHRQPAAPEKPAPCPDGHVPKLYVYAGLPGRLRCFYENGDEHWKGPRGDTPDAATREWNRGMKR